MHYRDNHYPSVRRSSRTCQGYIDELPLHSLDYYLYIQPGEHFKHIPILIQLVGLSRKVIEARNMMKLISAILVIAVANGQHLQRIFLSAQTPAQQQVFLPAQTQVQSQVQQQVFLPAQTQVQQIQLANAGQLQVQRQLLFNPMQQGLALPSNGLGLGLLNQGILGRILGGGMNGLLGGFGAFHDSDRFDNNDFLDSHFDRW